MILLEFIKLILRVTVNDFDDEIQGLIDECIADLQMHGVRTDLDDEKIKRAIRVYCKANFGNENTEREPLSKSYDMIRASLMLSTEVGPDYVA